MIGFLDKMYKRKLYKIYVKEVEKYVKASDLFETFEDYHDLMALVHAQINHITVYASRRMTTQENLIFQDIFIDCLYASKVRNYFVNEMVKSNRYCKIHDYEGATRVKIVNEVGDQMIDVYSLVDKMVEQGYLRDFYELLSEGRGQLLDMQYMNRALQEGIETGKFNNKKLIEASKKMIFKINGYKSASKEYIKFFKDEEEANINPTYKEMNKEITVKYEGETLKDKMTSKVIQFKKNSNK